jgi:predicted amidohydrolase
MDQPMQVIGCQTDIAWEDRTENFRRVEELLRGGPVPAGSVIVLPELFASGFTMNVAAIREGVPSATEGFMAALARTHRSWVIGGLVTGADSDRGRNQAVVLSPAGDVAGRYTKIHPFSLGGESEHYAAGDRVEVFDCAGFRLCPFVCYDLRFPEIFRIAVGRGANLFVVIANWPASRVNHWLALLQARAIENLAYVVGVNRCGSDPNLAYPGRSVIIDPKGTVLADGGAGEGTVEAGIDPDSVEQWRRVFPPLRDMHPEFLRPPAVG